MDEKRTYPGNAGHREIHQSPDVRVMVEEEMGGFTYSVQYTIKNKEMLQKYYEEDAARLRAKTKPFEGLFVAFRTELEIVSEQ